MPGAETFAYCAWCGRSYPCHSSVLSALIHGRLHRSYCCVEHRVLQLCQDRGVIAARREFVKPLARIAGSAYRAGEVPAVVLAPSLAGPWEVRLLGKTVVQVRDTRVADLDRLAHEGTDYTVAVAIRERLNTLEALWAQSVAG